ncbi:MAG: hypothetical protein AB7O44_32010 [Hyphomicrobiaceae bacterium]
MLFYFLGLGLIVFPLMLMEFAIGWRGRSDAYAITNVASEVTESHLWVLVGLMGIVAAFLISHPLFAPQAPHFINPERR